MKPLFFAERKLVYFEKRKKIENDVDPTSEGLRNRNYTNIAEAQRVMQEQSSLRNRLNLSDVLTVEDKKKWEDKLDRAKAESISENEMKQLKQEFELQQNEIKKMTNDYTRRVMTNETTAFTQQTAKEYIEWFPKQNEEEKRKALKVIDDDIKERIAMRKQLVKYFKKEEVYEMERTEMRDKVKTLKTIEKNIKTYKGLIQKDTKLFHDPDQYIKEFEDLTVEEQNRWIGQYEKEVKAPRQALVDIYNTLPQKHKHDAKFFKVGLKEKQEFLDKLDIKIEQEYIKKVNDTDSEVMSQNSKRFAIVDFLRLQDVGMKTMWLEQLPKSIKAEKKLAKEYKDIKGKFKDPNTNNQLDFEQYSEKEWEKLKFEEKEQLIRNMKAELKLIDAFAKILKQGKKDQAISDKTYERYMDLFEGTNLNGRSQLARNSLSAMKTRRDLVEDFEKLDKETQDKFKDFYKRGHKARLQMFKEAQLFESKNKTTQNKEEPKEQKDANVPKSLEQSDVQKIIAEMQKEADAFEATQQLERALDKHEDILKLNPNDQYSLKKQIDLKKEINSMDSLMDDEIENAVKRESMTSSAKEEIDQIKLAQMILDDREKVVRRNQGVENLGKQKTHLAQDTFTRDVHEDIHKKSGGKQILDKDGKIAKVEQVDLGTLGRRDKADIRKYKDRMKDLKERENLENIQLVDENTGRELRVNEARDRLNKRKRKAASDIAKRTKSSAKQEDVFDIASSLIEDELEKEAKL